MQREMICDLDATFSTRNDGQLVDEQVMVTQPTRTGAMEQIPTEGDLAGSAVPAKGLGFIDVNVPLFGKLDWSSLALGAIVGAVAWKFSKGLRQNLGKKLGAEFGK